MNFNPQEITARDLENPHFTAQDLQSIASVRPDSVSYTHLTLPTTPYV